MGVPYAAAALAVALAASAVSTTANFSLPVRHGASRNVTICLARDGRTLQGNAVCAFDRRTQRLGACTCPGGALVAQTTICWPGQHPASDTPAANHARYEAAEGNHGNLIGVSFEGRPFCQHMRDDGYPHWFFPEEGAPAIRSGN